MKNLLVFCAASALLFSCSDDNNGGGEDTPDYTIAFAGSTTASETLDYDFAGSHSVFITTDAPLSAIEVSKLDEQSWCELSTGSTTNFLPLRVNALNDTGAERSASFRISVGKNHIDYKVTQKVLNALSITELDKDEKGNYVYTAPFENADDLVFTVVTTASKWELEAKATYDDWWTVDKTSGVSGDKVTVSLGDNDSHQRTLTLTITADQALDMVVIITQQEVEISDKQMATYFTLYNNNGAVKDNANIGGHAWTEYGKNASKSRYTYDTDGAFFVIVGNKPVNGIVTEKPAEECHFAVEYDDEYIYIYPKGQNANTNGMQQEGVQFIGEDGEILLTVLPYQTGNPSAGK